MFIEIDGLPEGVYGIEASGEVHRNDVDDVMLSFAKLQESAPIRRLLIKLSDDFNVVDENPFDHYANWIDLRNVDFVALVASKNWTEKFEMFASAIGAKAALFSSDSENKALDWLLEQDI